MRHPEIRTAEELLAGLSGICPARTADGRDLVQISFPGPVRVTPQDARRLAKALKHMAAYSEDR